MPLIRRSRVEEDLERIRRANLPPEALADENAARLADRERIKERVKDVAGKEIFAMVLAALSVILPYVGVIALILLGFWAMIRLMAG